MTMVTELRLSVTMIKGSDAAVVAWARDFLFGPSIEFFRFTGGSVLASRVRTNTVAGPVYTHESP